MKKYRLTVAISLLLALGLSLAAEQQYEPALLFTDGEWAAPAEDFHSQEFLAWLFNDSSAPQDMVVVDRWGTGTRFGWVYNGCNGTGDAFPRELSNG